jgi:flavin reductase (DIM6/NTAB) family NADH-FMN oxidoreductase RutF
MRCNDMETEDRTDEMKLIQGKEIAAFLNPRPVVLVTRRDAVGNGNVLSVAWHTPLSHSPPMLGISNDTRRYSH